MSKSYGNAVNLADSPETIRKRILTMVTDPARKRRSDPGNPEVCPVFDFHKAFSTRPTIDRVDVECRRAGIGCIECKEALIAHLEPVLAPFQERRARLMGQRDRIREILEEGGRKARAEARETMKVVRAAMRLDTGIHA